MSFEMLDETFDWEDMTTSSSSCPCYIERFHRINHIVSKKREVHMQNQSKPSELKQKRHNLSDYQ